MPPVTLPAGLRRAALLLLTRERLGEIASGLGLEVEDRRSKDSFVAAIVRSRTVDFASALKLAKRDELKAICRTFGLDDSGREIVEIEPDTSAGEPPILPRIERHRPVGRTSEVMFRTTKPTKETMKSHVSHVVLDSPIWEGTAAYHLETSPRVQAWVKNDHLDFEILYEWEGRTHKYLPDFLVRVETADGYAMLVLEVKGYEREQDRAKFAAAEKWAKAVNNHGGFGRWAFRACKDPNGLRQLLEELAAAAPRTAVAGR